MKCKDCKVEMLEEADGWRRCPSCGITKAPKGIKVPSLRRRTPTAWERGLDKRQRAKKSTMLDRAKKMIIG